MKVKTQFTVPEKEKQILVKEIRQVITKLRDLL